MNCWRNGAPEVAKFIFKLKKDLRMFLWTERKTCACFSTSARMNGPESQKLDISDFPIERIRNFSIIAHIDHGKSTLADRLLELTGTVTKDTSKNQRLDKLQVERERGITVKAQAATLIYEYKGSKYLLNLIDTPGHVDFSYEVSRSLSACQGVILLVDANQGIQAQTVANFYLAFSKNLVIIPVLNKIDLKNANPEAVQKQMKNVFEVDESEVLKVSAKTGFQVANVLEAIIERIPPPASCLRDSDFKALIFDSWYDRYRGAIPLVAVLDGSVSSGTRIFSCHTKKIYEVREVGVLRPDECPVTALYAGQVGYITCNMRSASEALIGDTLGKKDCNTVPVTTIKPAKPMVFAGIFPMDQSETPELRSAIEKLVLNDSSVSVTIDSSPALGQGWRLGFLGLLHMEVFSQRLEQEYGAEVITTVPSVPYKVRLLGEKAIQRHGKNVITITSAAYLPEPSVIADIEEPVINGTIITPAVYFGPILSLCLERRGVQKEIANIDDSRMMLSFKLPLNEIALDFYDALKSASSGYASFDYEEAGYESSNLVKLNLLLNGVLVEELSSIVHLSKAQSFGRQLCQKLKEVIPRQQFVVAIQASIGGKVVARETLPALRKDVTAKLYGGDVTRRKKLLARQAEGKRRLKTIANIELPRETFIKVLKR
ncbi:translation factor GUF1 homolog, mitochondrial-like isoform X2 [Artemia franciscana]|uniref:translation factor GUF1 homolog, mitochondrial-like isoform X2 n=1 Tax=Artemia franciscana TaxID=6661 RepID=UPI0032DB810E